MCVCVCVLCVCLGGLVCVWHVWMDDCGLWVFICAHVYTHCYWHFMDEIRDKINVYKVRATIFSSHPYMNLFVSLQQ